MKTDRLLLLAESISTWSQTMLEHGVDLVRMGYEPHDKLSKLREDVATAQLAYLHALRTEIVEAVDDEPLEEEEEEEEDDEEPERDEPPEPTADLSFAPEYAGDLAPVEPPTEAQETSNE